jgi:isopentenyl-diphosphate delta-isomerase
MRPTRTSSRKQEHVNITLTKDVSFRSKTTGFERWEFLHNALPELNYSDLDTGISFLGKRLAMPLMISSMTGGYTDAERINRGLAEVCAAIGIAMGVGSQRQAIENKAFHRTFSVVREVAPEIPIVGNIGAAEVAQLTDAAPVLGLIQLVRADAFAVHLNPLQEFLQPEGNTTFRGVLKGIELLVKTLPVPVMVKEIGAGISAAVAKRLVDVGVRIIDVAGAGGTSWAGVEILRRNENKRRPSFADAFWDWGIPTVDALRQVANLKSQTPSLSVIASGGITSGLDAAKAIAFGADLVGAARPFLKALEKGGPQRLRHEIEQWQRELKGAMFLTGSPTIADLQQQQLVLRAEYGL